MARSPCKRMIRRLSRKLARERDNYVASPVACIQGEYWVDDDGNDLPPGNTYVPTKDPFSWQN